MNFWNGGAGKTICYVNRYIEGSTSYVLVVISGVYGVYQEVLTYCIRVYLGEINIEGKYILCFLMPFDLIITNTSRVG